MVLHYSLPHRRPVHVERRDLEPMLTPLHGQAIPRHREQHPLPQDGRRVINRRNLWITADREIQDDGYEKHERDCDSCDRGRTLPGPRDAWYGQLGRSPARNAERALLTNIIPSENGPDLK